MVAWYGNNKKMKLYKIYTIYTSGNPKLKFRDWVLNNLLHRNYKLPAETSPFYGIEFQRLYGDIIWQK